MENYDNNGYNSNYNGNYNSGYDRNNMFDCSGPEGKIRGVAALLALFVGGWGIQYFYLGLNKAGIISLILGLVTFGIWNVVMFIQGILMLMMTNAAFEQKYVAIPKNSFPVF